MKKVWCLYRVSTKGQVNPDEDIPMQRNACLKFLDSHPDWKLDRELYEKGISAWKNKSDDRDELVKIKKAAEQKKFDVLLVFMLDRLGRREDESPLVVQFLVNQGVEVWSVKEGHRKIEDHTDLLINYISFWQSSGESKKTSIRVKEKLEQMNEKSEYTGSNAPYGYEVYDTEQKHWKYDKNVKDMRINEEESRIVKLMFELYLKRGYGVGRIVRYLNENGYKSRSGGDWRIGTLFSIMKNPILIGKKRYNVKDKTDHSKVLPRSEWKMGDYREDWAIIDEESFFKVQETMAKRSNKMDKTVRKGKLLLNGIARCGYCHNVLNSDTGSHTYSLKDGTKKTRQINRYRCFTQRQSTIQHDKHSFTSTKYENVVIKRVKEDMEKLKLYKDKIIKQKSTTQNEHLSISYEELSNLRKSIASKTKEWEVLNNEIVKSLMGESKFKPEQLSGAIELLEKNIDEMKKQLEVKEEEYNEEKLSVDKDLEFINNIDIWLDRFDKVDHDMKKVMLSEVVKELYFYKDTIELELKVSLPE